MSVARGTENGKRGNTKLKQGVNITRRDIPVELFAPGCHVK